MKLSHKKIKYSELRTELGIAAGKSLDDYYAYLTHYLQNQTIPGQGRYITQAQRCLKEANRVYETPPTVLKHLKEDNYQLNINWDIPFPPPKSHDFTFIDLFAGVGGFRIAFQSINGKCVFSSEIDNAAKRTYEANFGEVPFGDIREISKRPNNIPDHDILLAGFPCQAFSIAGYRQGFADEKGRGNLFFDIYKILKSKQPKAFLLENVKNLEGHDGGNTFSVIKDYLNEAGYSVIKKVLNTMEYGNVPQNRERIYIVGYLGEADWETSGKETCSKRFAWPEKTPLQVKVHDLLEKSPEDYFYYAKYDCYKHLKKEVVAKDTVYQWRRMYVRENKKNVCPTLTANMGCGGHNVPIILDNRDIRKLTPRECFRLQGYPDNYLLPQDQAISQLYKQAGNSVSVPVIKRIAKSIMDSIGKPYRRA